MPASRPPRSPVLSRALGALSVPGLALVVYRYGGTALSELPNWILIGLFFIAMVLGLVHAVWPSDSRHRKEVIELLLTRSRTKNSS